MGSVRPGLLFLCVVLTAQAEQTPQELFNQVRQNVARNLERLPKYTCIQRQERSSYEESARWGWKSCGDLLDARRKQGRTGARLFSKNWFRLEVAVSGSTEVFSWPGGEAFETEDVKKAVRQGTSGTGDFGGFLAGIFLSHGVSVQYAGERTYGDRKLAEFTYRVPAAASRYTYTYPKGSSILGYHGSFWADPATGALQRVTMEATDLPLESGTCRVATEMNYQKLHIGETDFLLPEVSMLTLLYSNGSEGENETRYASCRQYLGESTVRFDDPGLTDLESALTKEPIPEIPAGLTLKIVLTTPIDPSNAAAGDPVDGVLKEALRDKKGKIIAPAATVMHGRVMHFEERLWPAHVYVLSVKFDRIANHRVSLIHKPRSEMTTFVLEPDDLHRGWFVSEWTTADPRPSP